MTDSIELHGNAGLYVMDGNTFSFQIGEGNELSTKQGLLVPQGIQGAQSYLHEHQWLSVNGYQVCMRGVNNAQCEEVAVYSRRSLPPSTVCI